MDFDRVEPGVVAQADQLDRGLAYEQAMLGAPDLAHAAFTQHFHQAVAAEFLRARHRFTRFGAGDRGLLARTQDVAREQPSHAAGEQRGEHGGQRALLLVLVQRAQDLRFGHDGRDRPAQISPDHDRFFGDELLFTVDVELGQAGCGRMIGPGEALEERVQQWVVEIAVQERAILAQWQIIDFAFAVWIGEHCAVLRVEQRGRAAHGRSAQNRGQRHDVEIDGDHRVHFARARLTHGLGARDARVVRFEEGVRLGPDALIAGNREPIKRTRARIIVGVLLEVGRQPFVAEQRITLHECGLGRHATILKTNRAIFIAVGALERAIREADADVRNSRATLHQIAQRMRHAVEGFDRIVVSRERAQAIHHRVGLFQRGADAPREQRRLFVDATACHGQVAGAQRALTHHGQKQSD